MKKFLATLLIQCLFMTSVFAAGKLQNEDFKTEAQLISGGATKANLLNDSKIYISANGINDRLDNAIVAGSIGGVGAGSVNLANGGFENNLTGWATYKNTAQALPVTGTGGSPTSTLNVGCASGCTTTTTPLYGLKSGVMNHPASNVQGEGTSYDFTIDAGLQGKVVTLSGAYAIVSGTYSGGQPNPIVDSDVEVYIYDKTNGTLIQPTSYRLDGAVVGQTYNFSPSFQTATNSTSYRMIFHYATNSASAFVLKYDVAGISSVSVPQGAFVSEWKTYPCVITGYSTSTAVTCESKRNADSLEIRGSFIANTPQASAASISLGYNGINGNVSIDTSKSGLTGNYDNYGSAGAGNGGAAPYAWSIRGANGGGNVVYIAQASTAAAQTGSATGIASGNVVTFNATGIPILGWGSSQALSSDTDSRVVDFVGNGTGSTQSLTANVTNVSATTAKDSHNAWTGSTYVVPVPGDYFISAYLYSGSSNFSTSVFLNGTVKRYLTYSTTSVGGGGQAIIENLKAGDVLSIRSSTTVTLSSDPVQHVSISRISGPSQIAASETISASYYASANGTYSTTSPINFDTKEYDDHNAVTTGAAWKFTAPISGLYEIKATTNNVTTLSAAVILIYKNGVAYKKAYFNVNNSQSSGSTNIKLLAGDYIDLRPNVSAGYAGGTITSDISLIAITRLGNY